MRLLSAKDAMYVTPKATKSIVSRIGSFPVTNDAVFAINGFLDELLYLLISHLPSDKMDISGVEESLMKLLPHGPLAREAIRSAHNFSKTSSTSEPSSALATNRVELITISEPDPDKTATYEQLRVKCLRYSTIGTEHANPSRLLLGPQQAGEDFTSITVLFITAILEYMARFLINSVAVMAKQQCRAGIGLEEVYSGLNIDDHIKGLFQEMMLYSKLQKRAVAEAMAKGSKNFTPVERKITTTGISRDTHEASLAAKSDREEPPILAERQQFLDLPSQDAPPKKGRSFSSFILKGKSKTTSTPSSNENSPSPKTGLFRFMPTIPSESQNLSHRSRSVEALRLSRKSVETTKSEGNNAVLDESFEEFLHANETKKITLTPNRLRSIEILKKKEKYQPRAPIKITPNLLKPDVPEPKKIIIPKKKAETLYEFLSSAPVETPPKNTKKYVSRAPVIMKRSVVQPSTIQGSSEDEEKPNTPAIGVVVKPKESIYDFLLNENSTDTETKLRPKPERLRLRKVRSTIKHIPLDNTHIPHCELLDQKPSLIHRRRRGLSMPYETEPDSIEERLNPSNQSNLLTINSMQRQRSMIELPTYSNLTPLKAESDGSESSDAVQSPLDTPMNSPLNVEVCASTSSTPPHDILSEYNRAFYPLCMCDNCE
ncbi:hypothetical protein K7432_007692 [Basidiobolus ranarum]|uniref:Uncharacterized protein n=1 Tax=Basidiobolus ranarum TaxID=34480 RepID=A0ABR2VZR0_9FUNG